MSDLPFLADVDLASESETAALGAALARCARPGDVLALRGSLGAGKTTLARGFISASTTIEEEVVSPTFTLVQVYDAENAPIWHFDLYRLERPADVLELGWDEALSGAISIVEWPERLGSLLPPSRLDIEISAVGKDVRRARLSGGAPWKDRIADMRHD